MIPSSSSPQQRVLVVDRTGELAARIRHHVAGANAVVKGCPDIGRAETHLAGAPWDVLVAGPSFMHRGGLRRLSALHRRYPWVAIVLALHERPRADLAEIVQVGADDLVPLHADDAEIRRTLARATRITRGRLARTVNGPAGSGRGRIVMIASASGGCGKTFLATNAAEFLVRTTDQPVVLLDLDLQFGEVSTALRLRPEVTIADALTAEAEGHDLDEILDDFLLTHADGFKVLAAPRLPAEADSITAGDVARILDVLRARGAWVVVDTHEGLSDVLVAALEATDHVFAVATPDRPSLVNLGRYLAVLEGLGVAAGTISVVLNKAETDIGFDAVDMAAQLGRRFEAIVPYSRDVSRSVNVGVPLIVGKPKSAISDILQAAFTTVLPRSRTIEPAPLAPAAIPRPMPMPMPIRVPVPVPPVAIPARATPAAELVEPIGAVKEPREQDVPEVDLSEPHSRRCPGTVRARPVRRCRQSTGQPTRSPCRGRSPPRPRVDSRPGPPPAAGGDCIPEMRPRPPSSRPDRYDPPRPRH